jgi:ribosomal protein L17
MIKELNELFIEKLGAEEGKRGEIEDVIEILITLAKKGDMQAIKEILERIYGRVKQDVEVKGNIVLNFDSDDKTA